MSLFWGNPGGGSLTFVVQPAQDVKAAGVSRLITSLT